MTFQAAAALTALLTLAFPSAAAAQAAVPFPVVDTQSKDKSSHFWSYLSMATGAALIGTSFVISDRANDTYDEYLGATDPERIAELYDETVRYDRLSAGTLIAGEVLLAAGVYFRFLHRPGGHSLELTLVPTRCEVSFSF
jgi:hypothetical protein